MVRRRNKDKERHQPQLHAGMYEMVDAGAQNKLMSSQNHNTVGDDEPNNKTPFFEQPSAASSF
jgi:hypothetical protein